MTERPILYQTIVGLQPFCREDVISGLSPWGHYPRPDVFQRNKIAEIIHRTILQVAGKLGVGIIPPIGLISPENENISQAEVLLSSSRPLKATALNFARPYLLSIAADLAHPDYTRQGELRLQATAAHEMYHIHTVKEYPQLISRLSVNSASSRADKRNIEDDVIDEFAALLYELRFVRRSLNGSSGDRNCKEAVLNDIWETMRASHPGKCIWMQHTFH